MFEDMVEKRIPHWTKQDNSILVDRSILKELNELRKLRKKIFFIINNQCIISRPCGSMRYIFHVDTLDGELVCMSMGLDSVIDGAINQIKKVRAEYEVLEGNWLQDYQWKEWFNNGGFKK